MTYSELDTVVLTRDIPEHALHTGDIGVIVLLYSETMVEVEFMATHGESPTITALPVDALRVAQQSDFHRATPQA